MTNTQIYSELQEYTRSLGWQLTDNELKYNAPRIKEAKDAAEVCARCPGRERCPHEHHRGLQIRLDYKGFIYSSFVSCEHDIAYRRRQRVEAMLESSRMPARLKEKRFGNFQASLQNRAYELAKAVAVGGDKGLLLSGTPGTGKTHLAAAIANDRLEQGREVIFVTVPELLSEIRRSMRDNRDSELMRLVQDAELLILDDLGAEKTTDWVSEQLFALINHRYLENRQTVITTNLGSKEFADKFGGLPGERILSRLTEMCEMVKMDGTDFRLGGRR